MANGLVFDALEAKLAKQYGHGDDLYRVVDASYNATRHWWLFAISTCHSRELRAEQPHAVLGVPTFYPFPPIL